MKSKTKDKTEGKKRPMNGKIKKTAGGLVGNRELKSDSKTENEVAKDQEITGDVEKALGN